MRALIILTLFTAFLTSCSGGKKKGVDPNTGLTTEEYDTLKAINDSFSDLDQAVEIGTSRPIITAAPSEKAQELSKPISEGGCQADGPRVPPSHTDRNWDVTRTVRGVSCPIEIGHEWHFNGDSQRRNFTYKKRYRALTRDFLEMSRLQAYQIDRAEFTVINKTAMQTLDGQLNYATFQVKDVGQVVAGIKTTQSYSSTRKGGGNLIFQLYTRKKVKVTVKVSWYTGRSDIYSVNGTVVGLNVIEDLFSAYELMEIKARSANLLY